MTKRPMLFSLLLAAALAPMGACTAGDHAQVPDAAPRPAGYELFASKDLDHDGALQPVELEIGLAPVSPDQAERMFHALDRDGDGRLVLAEYFPDPDQLVLRTYTAQQADRSAP